jgi:hypothetical protein
MKLSVERHIGTTFVDQHRSSLLVALYCGDIDEANRDQFAARIESTDPEPITYAYACGLTTRRTPE